MEGFELLETALSKQFVGFDSEWRLKVVQPPFATNFTEIWRRESVIVPA
jgi:hypothetical protein